MRVVEITGFPTLVAPTLAIKDGVMTVTLIPQEMRKVLDTRANGSGSIATNPGFRAARRHVSAKPAVLGYSEFRSAFETAYGGMIVYVAQMFSRIIEDDVPGNTTPTLRDPV